MEYEFEGRTEKEAIDRAAEELGLDKDDFDVEILEAKRPMLFKKGYVRIKVHTNGSGSPGASLDRPVEDRERRHRSTARTAVNDAAKDGVNEPMFETPEAQAGFEGDITGFIEGIILRMGYTGTSTVFFREDHKIGFKIDSPDSSILIGKKGKNLDALQLLTNIYAGQIGRDDIRIILDSENYRLRREEALVRMAYAVADRVRASRTSILLDPMNPFDRRLIHTTLNDMPDVETKSEGEGNYKQVRVYYRGPKN
jgi:spoIIIJ-associated protein